MEPISLLGATLGLGLVSGLNLYATVLAVGLGVRLGLIQLHPGLSHLEVLADPYVLTAAGAVYLIEFFADKIPWVDSLWDGVHTIVRPIGAALLGATAIGSVDPGTTVAVGLLCGGVAFSGHSVKAGTRVAVNHSPEPFTNIFLSLIEDAFAIFGAWLAVTHPLVMLSIVILFLAMFFWLSPKIFRLVRLQILGIWSLLNSYLLDGRSQEDMVDELPEKYGERIRRTLNGSRPLFSIRCAAGDGVKGLRNSTGYLCFSSNGLFFIARRFFRFRIHTIDKTSIDDVQLRKGLLFDRLTLNVGGKQITFYLLKGTRSRDQQLRDTLQVQTV